MTQDELDEDAMLAAVDLIGRTGATELQLGYLHEDVPIPEADWWAHARYQGTRVIEQGHVGPAEAAEALARRLLVGGRCRCGCVVSLSDDGPAPRDRQMVDGSFWSAQRVAKAGQCRWRREGARWIGGCGAGLTEDAAVGQ